MRPADHPHTLLTITETARRLGVTRKTVWARVNDGTIPHVVAGARRCIPTWWVAAQLEAQQQDLARRTEGLTA